MDTLTKIYSSFTDCGKKNLYAIGIAIYLIMIFLYMTNKPDVLYSKQYFYLSIILIPLIAFGMWFYKNVIEPTPSIAIPMYQKSFAVIALLLVCVGIYLYISKDISILEIKSAFVAFRFVEALMVLVILAIMFKAYIQKIDTSASGGWSGFFIQLIFFIPCLISDFIEYLLGEFRSTPNVVFALFIIEILLILFYIYLPKLKSTSMLNNGTILVKDPTQINMKKPLKTYIDLTGANVKSDLLNIKNPLIIKNKFSISGWVYIVSQPTSRYPYNDEATIFEFVSLHPKLIFNGQTNKFKAYFNAAQNCEFDMPLQKWNYVVFNYDKSNIDLFVNGKLEYSVKRNVQDDNFKINDLIYIGQERGLSGGICNLFYSDSPLIGEDILHNYNYNKYNEPPI
jgi:hypothetical protein